MGNLRSLNLIVLLALVWAPTFVFIKIGIRDIPPITFTFLRLLASAIIVLPFLLLSPLNLRLSQNLLLKSFIAGFIGLSLPLGLFSIGIDIVNSAMASIISGLVPLFTMLISHALTDDDKLSFAKVVGIIIGLVGLVIITLNQNENSPEGDVFGILLMVVGTISYSFAAIFVRAHLVKKDFIVISFYQLCGGSLGLVPFIPLEYPIHITSISGDTIWAILYLCIFSTILGLLLYYVVLKRTSASFWSLTVYVQVVIGVFLSVMMLDEDINIMVVFGSGVILVGLMVAKK